MPKQKFSNFGTSKLAASILATDTTINITAGDGVKFPVLAAGDYFKARIINSAKQAEIIKVTARATDQFTVERAQEGTTARGYTAGDTIQLILSRDLIAELLVRNPPVAKSANYSTVVDDDGGFHELGTGVSQVTLGDASTLRPTTADQWILRLKNVSSANITIARATGTDTINRAAANATLYPGQEITVNVNAARNGFETAGLDIPAHTAAGTDTYTIAGLTFVSGVDYRVTFTNANATTAPTLNAVTIKKEGGVALVAGDIPAGHAGVLRYNGTDLILGNPVYFSGSLPGGTVPLARMQRAYGERSGLGLIGLGTVVVGDVVMFSAGGSFTISAAADGSVRYIVGTSGTAAVTFGGGTTLPRVERTTNAVGAPLTYYFIGACTLKVTTAGTLSVGLSARADSNVTVSSESFTQSALVLVGT